jgi:hypothetical protein
MSNIFSPFKPSPFGKLRHLRLCVPDPAAASSVLRDRGTVQVSAPKESRVRETNTAFIPYGTNAVLYAPVVPPKLDYAFIPRKLSHSIWSVSLLFTK